ncbi:MAG: hypothetical protein GX249_12975 [Firmicutes bacterium]|nr:hypothetical protein [Bacillota bacterium]
MQYDAKNPKEYLELLDDDWRKDKLLVRKSVVLHQTGLKEFIETTIDLWRRGGDSSC